MAEPSPMEALQAELAKMKRARLSAAVDDVDRIITLLESAREQVASATDHHTASLTLTKLQNPIKERFEAVNRDLREVSKSQKNFGKALDKAVPLRPLPTKPDAIDRVPSHITKTIIMHLFREGKFDVASTFLDEARTHEIISSQDDIHTIFEPLETSFADLYHILGEIKTNRNLVPAMDWADDNAAGLESNSSNLLFDLSRLQFVWLLKGPSVNGLPDDERNGLRGALEYAKHNFGRFQARHARQIQQLLAAVVFLPNIEASPYKSLFETDSAFDDVAASFAREFCSLLNLSAESPLYLAVTAGAISLPQLLKYNQHVVAKKTEWTSYDEQPFETPLPRRMVFHPIFVCPVLKEQTTAQNPPMMLPCGHVVCKVALNKMLKGTRFKCPYCPSEGVLKDAKEIKL